jgi:hypothetical protein
VMRTARIVAGNHQTSEGNDPPAADAPWRGEWLSAGRRERARHGGAEASHGFLTRGPGRVHQPGPAKQALTLDRGAWGSALPRKLQVATLSLSGKVGAVW